MKLCICCCLGIMTCLLTAATPVALQQNDGLLIISAAGYQTVLPDPQITMPESQGGARFSRGGWLQSIKDRQGRELLRREDVFSWHPSRGMALEFTVTPSLYRESAEYELWLKPGVGIIRRTNVDSVEQLFPWQTRVENRPDAVIVQMTQTTPPELARRYDLMLQYEFFDQYFTITGVLGNSGKTELIGDLLLHPFFEPPADHSTGAIALPAADPALNMMTFRLTELPFKVEFIHKQLNRAQILHLKSGSSMQIECTPTADAILFWRSAKLESFSVEPLYRVRLKPGETFRWKYKIMPNR